MGPKLLDGEGISIDDVLGMGKTLVKLEEKKSDRTITTEEQEQLAATRALLAAMVKQQ